MSGCGGEDSGTVRPGEMRVLLVEPLGAGSTISNLIPNGDFSFWWAGSPAPEGFVAPDGRQGRVERLQDVTPGSFTARQSWRQSDKDATLAQLFRVSVTGLRPATTYRLVIDATAHRRSIARLFVFEERPGSQTAPLGDGPALEIAPLTGVFKRLTSTFTTDLGGTVHIAARGEPGGIVDWHRWALVEE